MALRHLVKNATYFINHFKAFILPKMVIYASKYVSVNHFLGLSLRFWIFVRHLALSTTWFAGHFETNVAKIMGQYSEICLREERIKRSVTGFCLPIVVGWKHSKPGSDHVGVEILIYAVVRDHGLLPQVDSTVGAISVFKNLFVRYVGAPCVKIQTYKCQSA